MAKSGKKRSSNRGPRKAPPGQLPVKATEDQGARTEKFRLSQEAVERFRPRFRSPPDTARIDRAIDNAARGTGSPSSPAADQPSATAPPKVSPQKWFDDALKGHPRQQGEQKIDYARRLYPLMQAANLTKPWTFETLRRRLDDEPDDKPAKPVQKKRRSTTTR